MTSNLDGLPTYSEATGSPLPQPLQVSRSSKPSCHISPNEYSSAEPVDLDQLNVDFVPTNNFSESTYLIHPTRPLQPRPRANRA